LIGVDWALASEDGAGVAGRQGILRKQYLASATSENPVKAKFAESPFHDVG